MNVMMERVAATYVRINLLVVPGKKKDVGCTICLKNIVIFFFVDIFLEMLFDHKKLMTNTILSVFVYILNMYVTCKI